MEKFMLLLAAAGNTIQKNFFDKKIGRLAPPLLLTFTSQAFRSTRQALFRQGRYCWYIFLDGLRFR